jgi:hypothetical protein
MTGDEVFATRPGDVVRGFRVYGTAVFHRFPVGPWAELVIGSGSAADVPLADETVSRRHAVVVRTGESTGVAVRDEGSKNGTYREGERRGDSFELRPAMWVAFGRVHVVACSDDTEAARLRLQRFLGYGAQYLRAVDDAHYAITHRQHLALVMPSSQAVALASMIHETVPGGRAPLVEPQRITGEAAQRAEYHAARGGTLVMRADRWPANPAVLRSLLTERRPSARLVFVAPRGTDVEHMLGSELRNRTIVVPVPTMEERGALETRMAIDQAAAEYGRPIGLSSDPFTAAEIDREWGSPEELEFFVRRGVRVKLLGPTKAAAMERASVAALSRWASRNLQTWAGKR